MKVVEESRLCGGTDFGVHIRVLIAPWSVRQTWKSWKNKVSNLLWEQDCPIFPKPFFNKSFLFLKQTEQHKGLLWETTGRLLFPTPKRERTKTNQTGKNS